MKIDVEFKKHRVHGLKPHKKDWRDYSHHRTFGSAKPADLPDEYLLLTGIMNQGTTPQCTAFASCAVRETQAGIPFNPSWFYAQEGVEAGQFSDDGYDLRTAMATGVDRGFKPLKIDDDPEKYKEASYFSVDGPQDLFDNVRSAMFLSKDEKRCAVLGTMWYEEWYAAPYGIIQEHYQTKTKAGLHAIKCAGWTNKIQSTGKQITIDGKPYLAIQNSWGNQMGDGGIYYFPRSVVDAEFSEGAYLWRLLVSGKDAKTANIVLDLIKKLLKLIIGH